jgi:hypothetical protein
LLLKRHGKGPNLPGRTIRALELSQPITELVNGTFVERAGGSQPFPAKRFPDLPVEAMTGGPPLTMIKIVLIAAISFASASQ